MRSVLRSFFVLLFFTTSAWASCPCISFTGTSAQVAAALARHAAAVFEASVISVDAEERQAAGAGRYTEYTTKLKVGRVLRGPVDPELVIRTSWGDCHFRFEPGRSYLVFAERDTKGHLFARNCVGAVLLEQAGSYLEYFRSTGSICGHVTRSNGDPVGDAPIFLWRKIEGRRELEVYKGWSESIGDYCVSLAEPGRYLLVGVVDREDPPLHLIGYYGRTPLDDDKWNVEIAAGAEFKGFDIVLIRQPLQTIRGRIVTDDGSPLPAGGFHLQLTSRNVTRENPLWFTRTDAVQPDGAFQVERIPHAPFTLVITHIPPDPLQRSEWAPAVLSLFTTKDRDDLVLTLRRRAAPIQPPKSR